MLLDLSQALASWSEHISHAVTTAFFIWFMLLRNRAGLSWMFPPMREQADRPSPDDLKTEPSGPLGSALLNAAIEQLNIVAALDELL
jgi:hypothetical protein